MDSSQEIKRHFDEACLAYEEGRLNEAETQFTLLLRKFPEAALLHCNLGLIRYAQKEYERAESYFKKAVELAPEIATFHFNLALSLKRQGRVEQAINAYQQAAELDPAAPDIYYNLAGCYRDLGENVTAIELYRKTLEIRPDFLKAHNNLASLLQLAGEYDGAIFHYEKVVALDPDHFSAKHMLAALRGETILRSANEYVISLFDSFAGHFEQKLQQRLEYRVPEALKALLQKECGDITFSLGLDLGCGTGLCGEHFAGCVSTLDGVDLSPKMIEIARDKEIYRNLVAGDLLEFMAASNDRYELFIAADLFIYLGELDSFFESLFRIATPGARILLSSETTKEHKFVLQQSGRFAHNPEYIEECARANGLEVLTKCEEPFRKEAGSWMIGDLWLLWKPLPMCSKQVAERAEGN